MRAVLSTTQSFQALRRQNLSLRNFCNFATSQRHAAPERIWDDHDAEWILKDRLPVFFDLLSRSRTENDGLAPL